MTLFPSGEGRGKQGGLNFHFPCPLNKVSASNVFPPSALSFLDCKMLRNVCVLFSLLLPLPSTLKSRFPPPLFWVPAPCPLHSPGSVVPPSLSTNVGRKLRRKFCVSNTGVDVQRIPEGKYASNRE